MKSLILPIFSPYLIYSQVLLILFLLNWRKFFQDQNYILKNSVNWKILLFSCSTLSLNKNLIQINSLSYFFLLLLTHIQFPKFPNTPYKYNTKKIIKSFSQYKFLKIIMCGNELTVNVCVCSCETCSIVSKWHLLCSCFLIVSTIMYNWLYTL